MSPVTVSPVPTLYVHPKDAFGDDDAEPGFEDYGAELREARDAARRVSADLAARAEARGVRNADGSPLLFAVVAGLVDWEAYKVQDGGWEGWPTNAVLRYRCFVVDVVNLLDGELIGDPAVQRAAGQIAELALLRRCPVLARLGPGKENLRRVRRAQRPEDKWGTWTLEVEP